jgi:hypothetical protein
VAIEQVPAAIGGHAARFDGRGAFIEVPHDAAFERAAISVEFWFKSTQPWQHLPWPGSTTHATSISNMRVLGLVSATRRSNTVPWPKGRNS